MNTPVLYLIFNRPKETELSFERIRQIRPSILYIAADGPRKEKIGETEKCQKVRAITEKIDWPCEVKRLYREENLGCGKAVSEAITWFFENEEQGIILEDDILPETTFFQYCEVLLEKYKGEERVFQISGCNFINPKSKNPNSYFFTQTSSIWGWATWARCWKGYNLEIKKLPETKKELEIFAMNYPNLAYARFELEKYKSVQPEPFTWDIQWNYHRFKHNGINIFPKSNLIQNIGFDESATHTKFTKSPYDFSTAPLTFPLKSPEKIELVKSFDLSYLKKELNIKNKHQSIRFINKYLYFIVVAYQKIKNV